jgi:beta-galactosidase/beta-glucuronidase
MKHFLLFTCMASMFIHHIAEVTLNDSLVLKANNMFRTSRFDCCNLLREKGNHIEIRFRNE